MGDSGLPVDRFLEESQQPRLVTAEKCFNGIVIDTTVIVGLAQSSASSSSVASSSSLSSRASIRSWDRDIEDFNVAIDALDQELRSFELDVGFFSHRSAWWGYLMV